MRKLDVLHIAAAAAFALATSFSGAMPTQAAGLSAKQKAVISKFVKCETYLLKGDLASFEADSDCGHGPVSYERSLLETGSAGTGSGSDSCSSGGGEWPGEYQMGAMTIMGGGYEGGHGGDDCHPEKKHDYKHKKGGKKHGKGDFPHFSGGIN